MTAAAPAVAAVDDRGYIRPEIQHLAVPVTAVTCYPGNARQGDRQKIRDSLLSHGQYKPILAQRSTGHVLVGNNTLIVMRQQGWTHVAVQFLDLDDTAARKLLLMDNRSSDSADYDTSRLTDLLTELPEYAGSGYWEMDVDRLLAELGGDASLDSLPDVTDVLPVSPAGPRLPDRATADPTPIPAPAPGPAPTPVPPPDPIPVPPPVPPAEPRLTSTDTPPVTGAPIISPPITHLPPVLPPVTRQPGPGPDTEVPWHLTLTRTDREEALRLVAHAREWLNEPGLNTGEIVMRALRTLAAIGDARHNPTAQVSITTLLMAAGRDPFGSL